MDALTILYIINATLLLLHEIESAYEKEWEIIKLPGKITGFLLMHIPIVAVLLWGLLEIAGKTPAGKVLALLFGIGGVIPVIIHKTVVRRDDRFNLPISNIIIYLNALAGIGLVLLTALII